MPQSSKSVNCEGENSKHQTTQKMGEKIKAAVQHYAPGPLKSFENWQKTLAQKRVSDQIDKSLAQDKQFFYKLLLFGTEQSGKTTILNHMRLFYGNGLDESEKAEIVTHIRLNIKTSILAIIKALTELSPPVCLEKVENKERIDFLQTYSSKSDFDYPPEFYEHVAALWKDKGIQSAYERRSEFHLLDCAKYFFDKIDVIKQSNYIPSDTDVLNCNISHTRGIYETKYKYKHVNYYMFEVADHKNKRHTWMSSFCDLGALIFVVPCDSYDWIINKDTTENKLKESIELFKAVMKSRFSFSLRRIIIFLNKEDLFTEKILNGKNKLEDYFPNFSKYPCYGDVLTTAKEFIRSLFCEHAVHHDHLDVYTLFTNAVNTENMKLVMQICEEIITKPYCACHIFL